MTYKMICILALLISGTGIYASQQSGSNDPRKDERLRPEDIVNTRDHYPAFEPGVGCFDVIQPLNVLTTFTVMCVNGLDSLVDRYRFSKHPDNNSSVRKGSKKKRD